ncbi:large ribosomal subunit protein uL22m-like [Artemia franciscana]|uniref:Large ribosomal subunit protein uL22m n=1 Tax=Artemia franciscana TaxID=6661 RepID=A0AA88I7C6_ARTSF|nr:hypothetical protein QYM36_003483 [Artemia franciscana]
MSLRKICSFGLPFCNLAVTGNVLKTLPPLSIKNFISTSIALKKIDQRTGQPIPPKKWLEYNSDEYPIQKPGEPRRPAFVCHAKFNIKYSPDKMWYVACFVRGMSVNEAIKQLDHLNDKGAAYVKETILEAQRLAVEEHNVEFKSNLWVADSRSGKGLVIKGLRRHARRKFGVIKYKYCHYFLKLEEGPPPKHYYRQDLSAPDKLKNYLDYYRKRIIPDSL